MLKWLFPAEEGRDLHSAKVIKAINHGSNVQLLCMDEGGLLSVYLDQGPFGLFEAMLRKAGMELAGALIGFDQEVIQIASLGKRFNLKAR